MHSRLGTALAPLVLSLYLQAPILLCKWPLGPNEANPSPNPALSLTQGPGVRREASAALDGVDPQRPNPARRLLRCWRFGCSRLRCWPYACGRRLLHCWQFRRSCLLRCWRCTLICCRRRLLFHKIPLHQRQYCLHISQGGGIAKGGSHSARWAPSDDVSAVPAHVAGLPVGTHVWPGQ